MSPKTFLITGVSSGLGRAFARGALDAGHTVVGTVRRESDLGAFAALAPGRAHARRLFGRFRGGGRGRHGPDRIRHADVLLDRKARGVLRSSASSVPRLGPSAPRAKAARSSVSQRSRTVGAAAEMSIASSPRSTTTDGPSAAGFHTRPISAASA